MPTESPIWPAPLDHLRLDSDDPDRLADFYACLLGFDGFDLPDGSRLLQGPGRRLVIGQGVPGGRPYHGFRLRDRAQLDAVRAFIAAKGINMEPSPSAVFEPDAVAVRDPDGWLSVFGLPRGDLPAIRTVNGVPGRSFTARLQHVVVASENLDRMMRWYEDVLGFAPSDYVLADMDDPDSRRVAFYRSDEEHHSFAVFAASESKADHHAYETGGWTDIRDWADHLARNDVKIWWGPGRHGPGNNLFFMIRDPHGDPVELSAEIERMPREMAARLWPAEERTLNLWGPGWIRD